MEHIAERASEALAGEAKAHGANSGESHVDNGRLGAAHILEVASLRNRT